MNDARRTVLIVLLVVVAMPLLWGGMTMGGMGPWMMRDWSGDNGRWEPWMFLWGVVPIVAMLTVAGFLVWASGRCAPPSSGVGSPSARDLLDARGEITREQYQQMRADLDS